MRIARATLTAAHTSPRPSYPQVIADLERLAGACGACVLVPDARVSLRVRPLRDVMIAHLKLWQHFSLNDCDLGRFGTAVHIA